MKTFVFLINVVTSLMMIDNVVTRAQHTNPPLTIGDYILRSCIASVVLIRNHRKSQLPALNATENNFMISNGNSIHRKDAITNADAPVVQHKTIWPVRDRMTNDTPLRTIDIKRGKTRDLIFMKKDHFPEISPSHYNDDIGKENAKIILIQSANRDSS